jgi:hypothetical protein
MVLAWPLLASATTPGHPEAPTSVIQRFFGLIDRHRPAEAAFMMGPEAAPSAASRAAWIRQLGAIDRVRVLKIRPSSLGEGRPCANYKVDLDVRLRADASRGPIPSYGWGPNRNVRWIKLCPGAGAWRIESLATGP